MAFLCFNMSIPDNIRCAASLHMLICHVDIFSGEVSVKMFGPFFELFSYCRVLRVLCVFWVTVLYQICICKYFLPVSKLVSSRIYNGLKTISLTSGAGNSGQPLVKE